MIKFDRKRGRFFETLDSVNAPRLLLGGWVRDIPLNQCFTKELEKVVDYLDLLEPALQQVIAATQADVKRSCAPTASEGFTVPLPEGKKLYPFQEAAVEFMTERHSTLLAEDAGLGKEQPVSEPILTPEGFKPIGDVVIGDTVVGSDGELYTVQGVYPQGVKAVYKITFTDGTFTHAGLEHLWVTRQLQNDPYRHGPDFWRTKTTKELLNLVTHKWEIPVVEPINFKERELPIHPYVMGALLGDGCLSGNTIQLTSHVDQEFIVDRVAGLLPEGVHAVSRMNGNTRQTNLRGKGTPHKVPIKTELDKLGLLGTGQFKFIPDIYLTGSIEQRTALLQGLMDTDGSVRASNTSTKEGTACTYHTRCKKLAEDVVSLVRSLGGRASIHEYQRETGVDITVTVHTNGICPFSLPEKVAKYGEQKPARKYFQSIEYSHEEESVCISVTSPDKTYITKDYIVTHNTPTCIALCNKIGSESHLIICPATVKYNWAANEWPAWTTNSNLTVGVVNGSEWVDTDVVVINYDILMRHLAKIRARQWDVLICDESHRLKSGTSNRTKAVLGGTLTIRDKQHAIDIGAQVEEGKAIIYTIPEISAGKRVFATATPMNRPHDLWTIARACDPTRLGYDYNTFCDRYCDAHMTVYGMDVSGASNLGELGALMRSRFMVRHDPKEVLPHLPPISESVFLLPEVQIILDIEEQFVRDNMEALLRLSERTGLVPDDPQNPSDWMQLLGETLIDNLEHVRGPDFQIMFTMFAKMRKETGLAKLPHVIQYLRDHTNDGELPTVVFGYHREVMDGLREAFPDHAYVMGGMKAETRAEMCRTFQRGDVNFFFGNIHAAGEGITLTRSAYLCFAEMDWQGTAMIQARKRIHRITQEQPCTIDYLCSNKSMDAKVYHTFVRKIKYIEETLEF